MNNFLIPLIAALAAPIVTYLVAARRLSGKIATSEAATLWEEGRLIREEYRRRFEDCEKQLKVCRHELQVAVARNTILSRENRELRDELRGYADGSLA